MRACGKRVSGMYPLGILTWLPPVHHRRDLHAQLQLGVSLEEELVFQALAPVKVLLHPRRVV